jgi:hypothetical protein
MSCPRIEENVLQPSLTGLKAVEMRYCCARIESILLDVNAKRTHRVFVVTITQNRPSKKNRLQIKDETAQAVLFNPSHS